MDCQTYGYVIAKEDVKMSIWDGSMDLLDVKKGDKLDITYTEFDGSLGFTINNVELCCSYKERKSFEEYWNKEKEQI